MSLIAFLCFKILREGSFSWRHSQHFHTRHSKALRRSTHEFFLSLAVLFALHLFSKDAEDLYLFSVTLSMRIIELRIQNRFIFMIAFITGP